MWLNKEVRQAINSKKKAFALLKQDGTIEALKNYREKNTLSKKLIKAAKKETEKHIAKESKTNPKLFFNYINSKRIKTENVGPLKNSEERMVVDDEEKANILNTFFSTVFTVENEMLGEIPRNNENPILRVTNLTQEEVRNRLNKIKIDKSPGPDGIHPRVLRELNGPRRRNPPERCPRPLYPQDCPEENHNIPEDHQGEDLIDIKVEVIHGAQEAMAIWADHQDGVVEINPPERCPGPLYSPDCPEENHNIPEDHQEKDPTKNKVKEETEEEAMTRGDQPCVSDGKEEIPGDVSTGHNKGPQQVDSKTKPGLIFEEKHSKQDQKGCESSKNNGQQALTKGSSKAI
ncbi:unnamed protein product [Ranitomeya imitator]|uniref:Uncharacterized protein n=1 Tax=Ranitomeya imitator TaxID=111125 RepID=A0ABN9M641_9NEOB|nr:unnamed protein product [Ranitomeya imitator]